MYKDENTYLAFLYQLPSLGKLWKFGQNYVIEGTLPSVKYDGEWIYLVPMENAPGRVDSVKITNASFFSGQGRR